VARIRSSPNESLLKIFTDTKKEKNKRKNRGRKREPSRPAVLIWSSERYRVMTRSDARRRFWSDFARAKNDFISGLRRSVVRDS